MRNFLFLISVLFVASCTGGEKPDRAARAVDEKTPLVLRAASFADLPGWAQDDQARALEAFLRSCVRIMKAPGERAFSGNIEAGTMADWQAACREAQALAGTGDAARARAFFEARFAPYAASAGGIADEGLFTGYYEASLRGARARGGAYQYPLHSRPGDLVMVELGAFREEWKNQRIAGRVVDGKLKPYEERAQIVAGQWPHKDAVLVWVDDPVDAFFLHIQGSGIVELEDGGVMRVGYDAQNGHPYYAIGRELVKRELMAKEDVSMQAIRAWLAAHPEQAAELMNLNKSYIFMKELAGEGPLGAENVVLTPGRSLAVDSGKMAYGVPVWLAAGAAVADAPPLRRLLVAQDTGGAIRGAVRGDVFFGHGEEAEYWAGNMKAQGRYWVLLPRKADSVPPGPAP